MKKNILLLVGLIIVAGLLIAGIFSPMIGLFGQEDYGTGRTINTTATKNTVKAEGNIIQGTTYISVENKLNHNDIGELLDSKKYITSWQPGEYSVPITAKCDMNFNTRWGYLWCYFKDFPDTMIQDYYWDVTYTDLTGKSIKVIDGKDKSILTDYVYIIRGSPRRNFPNIVDTSFAMVDTSGVSGKWYSWSNSPNAVESYTLETETLVFAIKGNRVGSLNVKCILADSAYAYRDVVGLFDCYREYESTDAVVLSEDNAYLPSGRGEVRIESTVDARQVGWEKTLETDVQYQVLGFEEGSDVTFSIDTGYSGTVLESDQEGYGEGWVLQIIDSTGSTRQIYKVPDGKKNFKLSYPIPKGSFIPNDPNDNEWMAVLSNTLFDQSETRIFVVDSYQKTPGIAKVTVESNQIDQFQNIIWSATASPNPEGTNDISHFRVWAVYGSPTSTDYALTARNYPAVKSNNYYTATGSFQVSKGDKYVYVYAMSIDSEGRSAIGAGYQTVYIKQVIPDEDGLPDIVGVIEDYTAIIAVIILIVAVILIYLYILHKKGKLKFGKRGKK